MKTTLLSQHGQHGHWKDDERDFLVSFVEALFFSRARLVVCGDQDSLKQLPVLLPEIAVTSNEETL